ncbi:MAG: SLC26A/SulP transporter family protein [Chloroflexaceae bacterium]|nr:SLC26A/SulP transporter family protein [Chloroflexaceae bacterium]
MSKLIPTLVGAFSAVIGLSSLYLSFAALIFSGELAPYVPIGFSLFVVGGIITLALVALGSSLPGVIAAPQSITLIMLVFVTSSVISHMAPVANTQTIFATVIGTIVVSTLLTGIIFLLLGRLGLGTLVRFIPYPVVGGFLAGTGWLLLDGSLTVLSGFGLDLADLPGLFTPAALVRWVPGLVFAVTLYAISIRIRHWFTFPGVILAGSLIFYAVMMVNNLSIEEARAQGWLLNAVNSGQSGASLSLATFAAIQWQPIFASAAPLGALLVISIISLLISISSIELIAQKDMDFNHELRLVGIANIVAGLGASPVGYHVVSLSALNYAIGASTRVAGLFAALFTALLLVIGGALISYFPRPVLGGLMLYSALTLLIEWIYRAWFRLSRVDFFLLVMTLVTIIVSGLVVGVVVGIVVAIIIFTVAYSRMNVIKHELPGSIYHSNHSRSYHQQQFLRANGQQIHILRLQGYLFFGTTHTLVQRIQDLFEGQHQNRLRFLILDLRDIRGLDSSATLGFTKLRRLARDHHVSLVYTAPNRLLEQFLKQQGIVSTEGTTNRLFADLDRGLEWCENQLIEPTSLARQHNLPLALQLYDAFASSEHVSQFITYLERHEWPAETPLFAQNVRHRTLFFIEHGRVSVLRTFADGSNRRFQTQGAGSTVGELEFLLDTRAYTTAITNEPTIGYSLARTAFERMQQEDPALGLQFHAYIARSLAIKLFASDRAIDMLMNAHDLTEAEEHDLFNIMNTEVETPHQTDDADEFEDDPYTVLSRVSRTLQERTSAQDGYTPLL